jgi:hypothetical protein
MNWQIVLIFNAIFLMTGMKLNSQTLTCEHNCPHAGEVFSTKTSSPVLHTSGQNQLWNFTQVEAVSAGTQMISYVDPSTTSSSSLFPQANLARMELNHYTFIETGNNGIKLLGKSHTTVTAHSIELPLPFSYGSSHTETIITTTISGADTIKAIASKTLSGVGTGTLMLPTATYNDVLRISGKIIESYTKNGLPHGYIYTNNVNYYYSEKISHPLLFSEYKGETGPNDYGPFTQFVYAVTTGIKNVNEQQSVITIGPNPTTGLLRITTSANQSGKIILWNSLGETLINHGYQWGSAELDLSEFPEGLYSLMITNENNAGIKKIVVSH